MKFTNERKSIMKRKISLILLLCLLFSLLCGCGGGAGNAEKKDPDSLISIDEPEEEEIDLYGAKFYFATGYMTEYFPTVQTAAGEKMKTRYKEVGNEYNCTFELYEIEPSTYSTVLAAIAGSGGDAPDLIDIECDYGYPCYKAGFFHPLDEISTINLSDSKWGVGKVTDIGLFNGQQYGFYPYDWEFIPQVAGALMFNLDLINQYSLENPFEIQERKDWKWDTFYDYMVSCTFKDGEKDLYGLQFRDYDKFLKQVLFSNEASIVNREGNNLTFALADPKCTAAFDFALSLEDLNAARYNDDILDFSVNFNSFFCSLDSYWGTVNIDKEGLPANIMKNWQFITFPYGPSGSPETVATYDFFGNRLNFVCELTLNDFNELGLVLDYVFAPLGDDAPEAWKDFAKYNFFLSDQTYENFIRMVEKSSYDYSKELIDIDDEMETLFENIWKKKNYAELIDKITASAQSALDSFVKNG